MIFIDPLTGDEYYMWWWRYTRPGFTVRPVSASLRESAEVNGTLDGAWLAVKLGFPSQRVCWWTPESLGDDMERPNRVAQLYGYAVCLIAVIVFLISANSFVEHLFTLSNPLRAR